MSLLTGKVSDFLKIGVAAAGRVLVLPYSPYIPPPLGVDRMAKGFLSYP